MRYLSTLIPQTPDEELKAPDWAARLRDRYIYHWKTPDAYPILGREGGRLIEFTRTGAFKKPLTPETVIELLILIGQLGEHLHVQLKSKEMWGRKYEDQLTNFETLRNITRESVLTIDRIEDLISSAYRRAMGIRVVDLKAVIDVFRATTAADKSVLESQGVYLKELPF